MKSLNIWIVALIALSSSGIFSSCSSSDDDSVDTTQAKAVAGIYKGYSVGESEYFSDYLMGDEATATITANEDGTINLVYKSGSGDFTLNNLTVSSGKFSGSGNVNLAMGGGAGSNYAYTLEASVDNAKVLTLKANIPAIMGGLDIDFIQDETPLGFYVANTYKYQTQLDMSVSGKPYGSTTECNVVIKRAETKVDITFNGMDKLSDNPAMALGDFTVKDVELVKGENGAYTLTAGEFATTDANGKEITGVSLSGTIAADGTANITVVFKPGSMPMPITAVFTGNHTQSSAE